MAGEGAAERVLRGIANPPRDLLHCLRTVREPFRGEMHPPSAEIRERRLADRVGEPARKRRATQVDLVGKRRERPLLARPVVQNREHPADQWIAERHQP